MCEGPPIDTIAAALADIAAGNLTSGLEFCVQRALAGNDPEQCYRADLVQAAAAAKGSDTRESSAKFKAHFGKKFSPGRFAADVREARQELQRNSLEAATPYKQKERGARPNLLNYLFNDHGNAERLIALSGDDLKYCHALKKWLVWDGRRWAVDDTAQARRLAKRAILEFLEQAVDARDEPAEKFAKISLDVRRITSLLSMAECEIFTEPDQLDTDPYLLNFLNGSVDLRIGQIRPHCRTDFITKLVHHDFHPDAKCPRWQVFLDQVMGGGPDADEGQLERSLRLMDYLQRALGYSLTGCTVEKAVFMVFGEGDNGKSTMLTVFRQLIDEYSTLLQVDTLMVRQESNNTQADLADLRGARFVQTSETEEGQRLAQGKLKRITQGMGKIKAVRKYENPIEFAETHKLWMDTNRKPTIRDTDDKATFNRLHPIPFIVTIPKDQIDRDLPAKLHGEAEGILAWAVQGAIRWHTSGLHRPPEVQAANDEWRAEMDQIGRFLEERCMIADGVRTFGASLYGEYKRWAEAGGEHPISANAFGIRVAARFEKKRTDRGTVYLGVGIREDDA